MTEGPASNPRWGSRGRDQKAQAIWGTLVARCGAEIGSGRWLDVGCGSGGIAATLASRVRHITGIDPEPWEAWNEITKQAGNIAFLAGSFDGDARLLPDGSVDVVICNQVYEHVGDPQSLIRNIHRVLVPGGVCYFAGPNLLWPIEPHVFWPFVHWLPRRFSRWLMTACKARYVEYLDAWSWPYWRLVRAFRAAGFAYDGLIPDHLNSRRQMSDSALLAIAARIPRALVSVLMPFSPGFIFLLTKPAEGARE
jgi:SAM-dependent methyltransferase